MSARPITAATLLRRVDQLELSRQCGPLSAAERVELDRLERDRVTMLSRPVDQMTDEEVDDYLRRCRSETAGRYWQLKDRARTPEEIAVSKARAAAIDAMPAEVVDAYLAGRAGLPWRIGR